MIRIPAAQHPRFSRLALMLRAFKYRNYRLFFGGQSVSLIGTWMQSVAMSWLVYRMTGSALFLGVAGFAAQVPAFLLSPFTGVFADRYSKHRILIITQSLAMLQAFSLAALVLAGKAQVWHIITLSALLGVVNAFDVPARQAFVIEMVERKEDLGNAIALNSSMFNSARLLGPSIAGVIISVMGEGLCFLMNGISYLAVIAALLAMELTPRKKEPALTTVLQRLNEGFNYTFGFAPIKFIVLLVALTSLTAMPYTVLMPIFAKDILGGGPGTLGFLMAFSGIGALAAALSLTARKNVAGLEKRIPLAAGVFGLGIIGLSFSRNFPVSAACIAMASFGMVSQMASSNTIIQTVTDDDKRGRVMAFYTMAFMGMAPFGSLLAGWTAERLGAPATIRLSGVMAIAGALAFSSRLEKIKKSVRPVYARLGIIPQIAAGIETASELGVPQEN
ncbi:MAG: MFS transporter [Elusimicrobiales bacterium]|jgi:MFS family permease